MHARYIKKEIADLNGTGRTQAVYQMKTTLMDSDEFLNLCRREGSMSLDALKGVVTLIAEKLALCMAEGHTVKLDGIGTFSAKLGVRADALPDGFEPDETRRNAKNIHVAGVNFRPDNKLTRETDFKCTLVKDGESRIRKPDTSISERTEKARQYLTEHPLMRVKDYVRLTDLSYTGAALELRRIAADKSSPITSVGQKSQKYYILRKPAP